MKRLIQAAALAAVVPALAGCIPVAAVPVLQGVAAVAADAFCSDAPPAVELRGDIRGALYGDRAASMLGDDCR